MFTKHRRQIMLAILFQALLFSCVNPDQVKIESMNFDQMVDPFQNLEFTFNRDLVPDSLIEKWDTAQYFTFNPEIKGRYKWLETDKLLFIPSVPFAPNTDYAARLNSEISRQANKKYKPEPDEILFHTPYLAIERSHVFWGISEVDKNQVQLRIAVDFNYPVTREDLRKYLAVKMNGESRSFDLVAAENTTYVELALPTSGEGLDGELSLIVGKGMKCTGSARELAEDEVLQLPVPPRDLLEISDVTTEFQDGEGVILVYTSQPVIEKGLRGLVSVKPQKEFSISTMGSGFKITGEFADGQSYDLNISGKLKGIFGPTLDNDFVQTVAFGKLQPYIAFSDQNSLYLTPQGSRNLGLNIINIPRIKITVFKVFENNIQHYMRSGKSWDWHYEDDEYYDSYAYGLDENYGKQISTREIDTRSLPKKGNLRLLSLKPEELELSSDRKGFYLIKAQSVDKEWLSDVQMVSVSDIGLIVKEGADEILVAARSIATAQPLSGVNIRFYSRSNQVIYEATTGNDGNLFFRDIKKTAPGFDVTMISARKNDDFNVLLYDRSSVETSRFDVGGKRTRDMIYDVFIYGDRNLYRPGDSVYVNAVVRSFAWETIQDIPVKFRVISPEGKDFLIKKAQLNKNGAAQIGFLVPESSITGSYMVEVLSGNDMMMGNYRVSVEEFMPDRIKVEVKPGKSLYGPGEILTLDIAATNLFGPPAANRKVENELRISRKAFYPKKFTDYNFFVNVATEPYFETQVSQGVTDISGEFVQQFTLPAFEQIGLLDAKVFTTVFDETGRPVNRFSQMEIETQKVLLGIRHLPGWVGTRKPLTIGLMAIDRKEKPVNAKARIEVVQLKWETVLERNGSQTTYRSQKKESVVMSREVNIPNSGYSFQFTPSSSGEYEVRVSNQGAASYVSSGFYAYGWSDNGSSAFFVNREGEIGIEPDKNTYQPGDVARLLFKTPFEGELLVTVEQDKVLEYYSLKADASGAGLNLNITSKHLPNIYISATLIRKNDASGLPLTVGHGYASLKVEDPGLKMKVDITAPGKIRSKTKQQIKVKTAPGAEVTIAVVDEGILQITAYQTPDPYNWFYGKRALEVQSYDLFDELFPELSSRNSSTGGDMGFDLGRRLNPLTSKRVKLLSLWSGVQKANGSGEVTFNADIPAFSGAVRIMAVAYKGDKFGSSQHEMKVSDPLVISSSLPRFLSPGDVADVLVTFTNTTAKALSTSLKVVTDGAVTAGKFMENTLNIPANSEMQASFELTARKSIGNAKVKVQASAGGETFTEETEITVRPAATLEKSALSGVLKAGKPVSLKADGNFIEGTAKSRLLLTRSPAGQYARDLGQLVNYPHGCLEQTISTAFPQIYFPDLARMLKQEQNAERYNTAENINAAIMKISALQQYNGGLVMWPSGGEVHWWATAYAGNFLYEASKAGYTVNQMVVDNIMRYLTEKVKQKPATEYFYQTEGNNQWQKKLQPQREIFYSLYVLALNGKQHLPTMNYYKARHTELTNDSKYMLASTYALIGDSKSYRILLPKSWDQGDEPAVMTGGSFSSPIRDRGIALYTFLNADATHPQVAELARQLGQMIARKSWMSTQERAFAMMALGKLAGKMSDDKISATVEVGGRKTATFNGDDLSTDFSGETATVTPNGTGQAFYYFETQGIPVDNSTRDEDNVLSVRRRFYDRLGNPLGNNSFNQNDLVVVELTLSTTDNSVIENVIISDLLPACFEVENTRLNTERGLDWIKNRSYPDHIDFRDDRVNLFANASGQNRKFYYMVRVVGKGTFKQGPVSAEAMYNGAYYSYSGSSMIVVK
jgi:uncharacterized protein YfaS (alpha-2-macroglobulin family)